MPKQSANHAVLVNLENLHHDGMVCILPENHLLGTQPFIHLQDFSRMDLISHAEKGKNKFYQAVPKPRGIEPKRLLTVGQPHAIIEMVASGIGFVVSPSSMTTTVRGEFPSSL